MNFSFWSWNHDSQVTQRAQPGIFEDSVPFQRRAASHARTGRIRPPGLQTILQTSPSESWRAARNLSNFPKNWTLQGDAFPSDELSMGKSPSIAEPVVKRFSLREEPVRKRLSLEVPDEPPVPMTARTARRRNTNSGAGRRPRPGPAESGRRGWWAGGNRQKIGTMFFLGMMVGHGYTCCMFSPKKQTTDELLLWCV